MKRDTAADAEYGTLIIRNQVLAEKTPISSHGQRRTSVWKVFLGLSAACLAVLILGFFYFATVTLREQPADIAKADAIVVLTGGSDRLRRAGELFRKGKANYLLVSGVNKKLAKAKVQELIGISGRKFDCCVKVGYFAQNTRGNAIEARDWLRKNKFKTLIVVTAAYHMPRSMAELSLAMPDVKLIPYAVVPSRFRAQPWWLHSTNARILAQEYIKFLPIAAHLTVDRILRQGHFQSTVDGQTMHAGTNS
ncbi:MAG: YdcF family protein [Pseudomonadota bacterium]